MLMHPWMMTYGRSRNLKSKASSRYIASRGGSNYGNLFSGSTVEILDGNNRPSTSVGER